MKGNNTEANEKTMSLTDRFVVTVEIIYNDQWSKQKTAIVICDTMEEAIIAGNKALDILKTNGFIISSDGK